MSTGTFERTLGHHKGTVEHYDEIMIEKQDIIKGQYNITMEYVTTLCDDVPL